MSYKITGKNGETIEVVSIEPGMQKPIGNIGVLAFGENISKCTLIDPEGASEFGGNFSIEDALKLLKKQIINYQKYTNYIGFHIIDISKRPEVQLTLYAEDLHENKNSENA